MLQSSTSYAERPDVVKKVAKATLEFKEVSDLFIKFLQLSDVPFTGKEALNIVTYYVYKKDTKEEQQVPLNSQNYYTATCRLEGLTVNGQSVYIVTIPDNLSQTPNRQKNRILQLKSQYNVIIFDQDDWEAIGIDISDKKWLKPLGRGILKNLARRLFSKINELGGTVQSDYTLNDLFSSINFNTSSGSVRNSLVEKLSNDNFRLRSNLRSTLLSSTLDIKDSHSPIIDSITSLGFESLKWLESTTDKVISDLDAIDIRKKQYKERFRQKNGKIVLTDKEKIANSIYEDLLAHNSLNVVNLGQGVLQLTNKSTLETLNIVFTASSSASRLLSVPNTVKDKLTGSLLFNIHLVAGPESVKPSQVLGYITLLDYAYRVTSTNTEYTVENKLPVYKEGKFTLYSEVNNGV